MLSSQNDIKFKWLETPTGMCHHFITQNRCHWLKFCESYENTEKTFLAHLCELYGLNFVWVNFPEYIMRIL